MRLVKRNGILAVGACVMAIMLSSSSLAESRSDQPGLRTQVFDVVWDSIRRDFYNADALRDWDRARERFRPDAIRASDTARLYSTINRMVQSLGDFHTRVVPPAKEPTEHSNHQVIGLGISASPRLDGWHVTSLADDGPGVSAGLQIGTIIIEVLDGPLEYLMLPELGRAIDIKVRDPDGSLATRTLLPAVMTPSDERVDHMLSDGILHIWFSEFSPGTTDWIAERVRRSPGITKIILDLRGNTGGKQVEAARLMSYFRGTPANEGHHVSRNRNFRKLCDQGLRTSATVEGFLGPTVVLIDRYSLSAAELVASSLQTSGRALIVGETSGGEVTCTITRQLPDRGSLRIGVAAYVTAEGVLLNDTGVVPDIVVDGLPDQRRTGPDLVLEAAHDLLARPQPH